MKMVALGELMVARAGSVNPATSPHEGFELYSIPAHDRGGPEVLNGSAIGSAKQIVQPNDVMVSKIIPHVRRARIVQPFSGKRQIASGEWIIFRGDIFAPDFLKQFLLSDLFHRQFMNTVAGVGGSLVRARPAQVKAIEVPLPPMEEQRRIAAILDQADEIRAKRRQQLAYLDTITQAIFHDMVDPASLQAFALGEVVHKIDSGTSVKCEARPAARHEWGILKLSAVTYGAFLESENKAFLGTVGPMAANEVHSGDVLMTRKNTRELVGAVALVPEVRPRLLLPDLIFRIHLDRNRVDRQYFQTLMMSPEKRAEIRNISSGSAASMPNISKARLVKLMVEIPPLNLQREFAHKVDQVNTHRAMLLTAQAAEDELFAALQARAFRGEL